MTDRAPGNEIKDKSAADLNAPDFELGTQWSEVECSTQLSASSKARLRRGNSALLLLPLHCTAFPGLDINLF